MDGSYVQLEGEPSQAGFACKLGAAGQAVITVGDSPIITHTSNEAVLSKLFLPWNTADFGVCHKRKHELAALLGCGLRLVVARRLKQAKDVAIDTKKV